MKTVLAIDDNCQIREMLVDMLNIWAEEHPFSVNVIEHCDGAEALQWVKDHGKPDLVLLDVRMPEMGGAEFLRQVAGLGYDFRPFTLLLTGYADDLEDHLGSDALLMKHLRKPFMVPELFAALDSLL